jgi:hypothetical protein
LEQATTSKEVAENIQSIIDLLEDSILKQDLSSISPQEIVKGNIEHAINLTMILFEVCKLMADNDDGEK